MSPRLLKYMLIAASIGLLAVACDDPESPPPGKPAPTFQNLTQKGHVLNNIEVAYNKRDAAHYDALLSGDFTFFYTDGGVGGTPAQWDRFDEMTATNGIFFAAGNVELNLDTENGVTWDENVPPSAPTETWYTATVDYSFTIKIGGFNYVPDLGSKATFTVRNAGSDEAPHWQLIEMRDLGSTNSLLAVDQAKSTEQSTWGQVKALARGPVSPYRNLTQKINVLNNIQVSYNFRDVDQYNAVLDDNFAFFYTDGDVGGGTPVQWGRVDEMTATNGLFGAASETNLDVKFEQGVTWIAIVPGSAPTETWYTTTVFYDFAIKIGDTTYIPSAGSKAQFTVRDAGTEGAKHWQLVEMRDLGGPTSLLALRQVAATEASTWGQVKALYR